MTENELIEALREALEQVDEDHGGLSAQQVSDALGIGQHRTRDLLRGLGEQDRLDVLRVRGTDLAGRPCQRTRYKLKPAPDIRKSA